MKNIVFCFLTLFIMLGSCKKEIENFEVKGQEYVADKVGRVRIYRVDSMIFNRNTTFPPSGEYTVTTYEKQEITHIEKDSSGKPYYYTLVSTSNSLSSFVSKYAFKTQLDGNSYHKVIDNNRVILLTFPMMQDKSWDGNIYNPLKGVQKFKYIASDEFLKPDSIFQNQFTVRQIKDILPITSSHAYFETYAPGKGMVYSIKYFNEIQSNGGSISESGFFIHYNLIYFL